MTVASQIETPLAALAAPADGTTTSRNASKAKNTPEADFGAALAGMLFALAGVSPKTAKDSNSSGAVGAQAPAEPAGTGASAASGAAAAARGHSRPGPGRRSNRAREGASAIPAIPFNSATGTMILPAPGAVVSQSAAALENAATATLRNDAHPKATSLKPPAGSGASLGLSPSAASQIIGANAPEANSSAGKEPAAVAVEMPSGLILAGSANSLSPIVSNGAPAKASVAQPALQNAGKPALSPTEPLVSQSPGPARSVSANQLKQASNARSDSQAAPSRAQVATKTQSSTTAPSGSGQAQPAASDKTLAYTHGSSASGAAQADASNAPAAQAQSDIAASTVSRSQQPSESARKQTTLNEPPAPPAHQETLNTVFASASAPAPQESAAVHPAQPAAPGAPVTNYPADLQQARVANLQVALSEGHTARATIREASGTVDLKIVAPDAGSAQRISEEMGTLRTALNEAGLRLRAAQVNYRNDPERRGQGGDPRGESAPKKPGTNEIFTVEEVNR